MYWTKYITVVKQYANITLVNIDVDQKVYVIGTVKKYEFKTKDSNGKLILNDCFASK